jgi:integrase
MDALGDPDAPDGDDYWHEHVVPNASTRSAALRLRKLLAHFGALAIKDIMPGGRRSYVPRARRAARPPVRQPHHQPRAVGPQRRAHHDVKEKRLPLNDKPFIKLPGTSPPRDRWLEFAEAERLLIAALERVDPHLPKERLPRVYRFAMIGLEAAGRKTSILQLQRKMVDLQRGLIDFNPPGRVQTNKKRPIVKISSRLRPVIERTLIEIPDDPDAYLLDHPGCIRTAFENCVARAGLGRTSRRTFSATPRRPGARRAASICSRSRT